jgi:hypothetical protein
MFEDLAGSSLATTLLGPSGFGFRSTLISALLQDLHVKIEVFYSFSVSIG